MRYIYQRYLLTYLLWRDCCLCLVLYTSSLHSNNNKNVLLITNNKLPCIHGPHRSVLQGAHWTTTQK